jgi:hypothetical protein
MRRRRTRRSVRVERAEIREVKRQWQRSTGLPTIDMVFADLVNAFSMRMAKEIDDAVMADYLKRDNPQ